MRGYKIILSSLLLLTLVFFSGACDKNDGGDKDITSLISVSVTSAPTIDGSGSDAVWNEADAFVVTTGVSADHANAFGEIDVTLKSVHTSSDVYILASWSDHTSTENVDKNLWSYSGGTWSQSGNEDRIYFMFDMGENGTEGSDCSSMCHVAEGKMWTTGGGRVDVWHWKAHRTNPIGLADDKYFDGNYTEDDGSISKDGGRHGDSKTISAYKDNKTSSGNFPLYAGPVTDGSFIIIESGKSTADLTPFDSTDTALQANTYPGYYLNANADGSRADVKASGKYNNGVWTVEFKRALNTTHDDDAAFTVGSTTKFSVAVTDNSGGDHSGAGLLDFTIK